MAAGRRLRSGATLRLALCAWTALGLGACMVAGRGLPPPPVHPNGLALWRIVHDLCVPGEQARGRPSPCAAVSLTEGVARGSALLKDRVGVGQHLLIPTARITGIEDPALLAPDAPNFFARAWAARGYVEGRLVERASPPPLSIAVNSQYGRSQDQLHLHIDCLRRDVAAALRATSPSLGDGWSRRRLVLRGRAYSIRWLAADKLATTAPFALLAKEMPGARAHMAAWTIALTSGATPDGSPGFWLLADHVDLRSGDLASSEELQDHQCR
ncbi:MAG: CDP-diacylglycerol diphosphatase [Caulobacteraceae bacterium]|nr:CDP-diacylglycerol diphosphatase [Caulobacter sp.]